MPPSPAAGARGARRRRLRARLEPLGEQHRAVGEDVTDDELGARADRARLTYPSRPSRRVIPHALACLANACASLDRGSAHPSVGGR